MGIDLGYGFLEIHMTPLFINIYLISLALYLAGLGHARIYNWQ